MSPLLKAIGVGLGALLISIVVMWLTARILNRPFFPQWPRSVPTATPSPTLPPLF